MTEDTESSSDGSTEPKEDDEEIPVEPDGSVYVRTVSGLAAKATDWERAEAEGEIVVNEREFIPHASVPDRALKRLGLDEYLEDNQNNGGEVDSESE